MKKGPITAAEAGRRGGVKIRDERGAAYFRALGKNGGEAVKAKRGPDYYREIGRRGGLSCHAAYGQSFYEAIGSKGGQAFRAKMAGNGGDKCADCTVKRVLHAQSPQACSAFVEPELARKGTP